MVTVIDLTTGALIYSSREAQPMATPHEPLVNTQAALQLVGDQDYGKHGTVMPPDLADVCVDDLLARWQD